jgi:hypothetical protein
MEEASGRDLETFFEIELELEPSSIVLDPGLKVLLRGSLERR